MGHFMTGDGRGHCAYAQSNLGLQSAFCLVRPLVIRVVCCQEERDLGDLFSGGIGDVAEFEARLAAEHEALEVGRDRWDRLGGGMRLLTASYAAVWRRVERRSSAGAEGWHSGAIV